MSYLVGLTDAGASGAKRDAGSGAAMPVAERLVAERVFPALAGWRPVLDILRIPFDLRPGLAAAAEANRWRLGDELIARGSAGELELYEAVAKSLDMQFQQQVDPEHLIITQQKCAMLLGQVEKDLFAKQDDGNGQTTFLLAPTHTDIAKLRSGIEKQPGVRGRLRLVAPSVLREALRRRAASLLLRNARLGLFERSANLSARLVLDPWQGAVVGAMAILLPLAGLFRPSDTLMAIHVLASAFFVGCVALRCAASRSAGNRLAELPQQDPNENLPTYSVLVALYREEDVVFQLIEALARLDWPHGRLDVKLVCEADDTKTIAALRSAHLAPFMEIVAVPASHPRTKPKALNYALPTARGELIVLFDAEDRPDPAQLREAWARFRRSGPELACVQAPLKIANGSASFPSRMFSFEYAALFCGLLPFLARHGLPLPLGGTSNHFRRDALTKVGGWDPFNVTEDADLAVRLARLGFRTEVITRPTLEDAPEEWSVWLPQRTRWFKGYMQSWLVHMRDPAALLREIGWLPFLTVQTLYAGLVVSSLVHPLLVATLLAASATIAIGRELTAFETVLMIVDALNVVFGYVAFLWLGWRSATPGERRSFGRVVLGMPIYWLMLSVAAWRAVGQLCLRPHHWNKTPHRQAVQGVEELPATP